MTTTAKIDVAQGDLLAAIGSLLHRVLTLESIDALLVPQRLPYEHMVMPTLVTSPDHIASADPLSPAYPLNSAKIASRLTRKSAGGRTVLVLRPCEVRAFFELVKLHQGHVEEVVIVGIDCLGAYRNTDYLKFSRGQGKDATRRFYEKVLNDDDTALTGVDLAAACRVCDQPFADGADVAIGLRGVDTSNHLLVTSQTDKGDALLAELGLDAADIPAQRQEAINALLAQRHQAREQMFGETRAATDNLEKLAGHLAACVNCYNCRVACPVCYCRECVFVTDVFDHEPAQYLQWAARKGRIKMPTDTVFYHLTRLAHMSTACVGCGQCSNACPNEIPLAELFITVAHQTQKAFDYLAGRSLEERPPLSEFRENEFKEIVGINA